VAALTAVFKLAVSFLVRLGVVIVVLKIPGLSACVQLAAQWTVVQSANSIEQGLRQAHRRILKLDSCNKFNCLDNYPGELPVPRLGNSAPGALNFAKILLVGPG
jgi:curli biogenesis system outer membrane secretion channel CsgG